MQLTFKVHAFDDRFGRRLFGGLSLPYERPVRFDNGLSVGNYAKGGSGSEADLSVKTLLLLLPVKRSRQRVRRRWPRKR